MLYNILPVLYLALKKATLLFFSIQAHFYGFHDFPLFLYSFSSFSNVLYFIWNPLILILFLPRIFLFKKGSLFSMLPVISIHVPCSLPAGKLFCIGANISLLNDINDHLRSTTNLDAPNLMETAKLATLKFMHFQITLQESRQVQGFSSNIFKPLEYPGNPTIFDNVEKGIRGSSNNIVINYLNQLLVKSQIKDLYFSTSNQLDVSDSLVINHTGQKNPDIIFNTITTNSPSRRMLDIKYPANGRIDNTTGKVILIDYENKNVILEILKQKQKELPFKLHLTEGGKNQVSMFYDLHISILESNNMTHLNLVSLLDCYRNCSLITPPLCLFKHDVLKLAHDSLKDNYINKYSLFSYQLGNINGTILEYAKDQKPFPIKPTDHKSILKQGCLQVKNDKQINNIIGDSWKNIKDIFDDIS